MIVGGLRVRLLRDSLHSLIDDSLRDFGWYDTDRSHRTVVFLASPLPWNVPVEPNTIALELEDSASAEVELGSGLTMETITAYVDIYAQNDSFGVDISNDIRDVLRGRLGPLSQGAVPIYDYRQATPPVIGHMIVDNVSAVRDSAISTELWMRHRFRVRCEIQDTYYTSEE